MKKLSLLIIAGLMLTGCGKVDRVASAFTGDPSRVCVAGVTYLQFTSGAAVMVDATGKPVTCR